MPGYSTLPLIPTQKWKGTKWETPLRADPYFPEDFPGARDVNCVEASWVTALGQALYSMQQLFEPSSALIAASTVGAMFWPSMYDEARRAFLVLATLKGDTWAATMQESITGGSGPRAAPPGPASARDPRLPPTKPDHCETHPRHPGFRTVLESMNDVRMTRGIWLGDSGMLKYGRGKDKNKRGGKDQSAAFRSIGSWPNMTFTAGSGYGPLEWANELREWRTRHTRFMIYDAVEQRWRFPADFVCVVMDGGNVFWSSSSTYSGMTPTAAAQYYALFREMANFTAAVYVYPADGRRFGIQTPAYDEDVECARLMASDACLHVIPGQW